MIANICDPGEKLLWHYIDSYPVIPAGEKYLIKTIQGYYSLYPTVEKTARYFDYDLGYVLVRREKAREEVVAVWLGTGAPDIVYTSWLEREPRANEIIKLAKKWLQKAWDKCSRKKY